MIKLSNQEDEAFRGGLLVGGVHRSGFHEQISTSCSRDWAYIKSSGGTAIYDALVASADYLSKNAKHPKQVLLVVTDGEDNASSGDAGADDPQDSGSRWSGDLFVGLLFGEDTDKRESRHAKRVLETLSEQTGGAAYFPRSLKEVDAIAAEVAQDIRTQYTIAYHSTKSPTLGGYRRFMWRRRRRAWASCRCGRGRVTIRG